MFKNIFKKTESKALDINRVSLTLLSQLEEIKNNSSHKTILIFKHSTRCGISGMVLKRFENQFVSNDGAGIDYYLLDLLNHRDISSAIAEQFQVVHQSPQLLVINDCKVTNYDSHYGILDVKY